MKKRIVLCADDYGQAEPISKGILTLVEQHRLSAVSCMVNSPLWHEHATWLLPYRTQIDVGLHFNLTEGKALSTEFIQAYGNNLFPLNKLMLKALLRQLDQQVIEAECRAQLSRFKEALGYWPDFLDGHQHVQQFPVIRQAIVNVFKETTFEKQAYIRLVDEKINNPMEIKKRVIRWMGTNEFKKLLKEQGVPFNVSFSGIYEFSQSIDYNRFFPEFLKMCTDKGLIMCHPGLEALNTQDSIAKARYDEYQYFISPQFLRDCEQQNTVIGRFF